MHGKHKSRGARARTEERTHAGAHHVHTYPEVFESEEVAGEHDDEGPHDAEAEPCAHDAREDNRLRAARAAALVGHRRHERVRRRHEGSAGPMDRSINGLIDW